MVNSNGFAGTYHSNNVNMNNNNNNNNNNHKSSNNNSIPLRPKALSLGSYSLGSSGEISSPPSSQSGSPTSLNSFFTEDPFNAAFVSPNNRQSFANTAFSFSSDFAPLNLITTTSSIDQRNNIMQHTNSISSSIDSQPSLCAPNSRQRQHQICDSGLATIYSNMKHHQVSSPPALPSPPASCSSPDRDSVTSADDKCMLNGSVSANHAHMHNPMPTVSSIAPSPPLTSTTTCTSPLDINSKNLPRLPIFARFANNSSMNTGNGNNNDSQ